MTPEQVYNNWRTTINKPDDSLFFFAQSAAAGGDMNEEMAEELLDDLSTDGKQIFSDKISSFGSKLLTLTNRYGFDIPISEFSRFLGN